MNKVVLKEFEKKYLRMGFEDSITLIRIIDSRTEGFSLSAAYKHKVRGRSIRSAVV